MKKIPTIFKRNPEKRSLVLNEITTGCEWVLNGEGFPTRKYDGTCCKIEAGKLYKRRELKKDSKRPDGFDFVNYDESTGKTIGWVPVSETNPEDKWHREAYNMILDDGTYELLGPKIQGNPEKKSRHVLLKHSYAEVLPEIERSFEGIKTFLSERDIEGIVFHHPDGRMAKIKKRDFGMKR